MAKFESLLNKVKGQSKEALITFFIGDLKSEIRSQLKIARPTTLRKDLAMAKIYESNRVGKTWKNFSAKTKPINKTPPAGRLTVPIVRRTLTVEERRERTAKAGPLF